MNRSFIQSWRQASENFWRQRSSRDRKALGAMAVVVVVALSAQGLWSLHEATQRLRHQLPRLASQVEQLKADANELRRLSALPARQPAGNPAALQQEITAQVQALGLSGNWRDGATMAVSGQVPFDDWVAWLGQVHRDQGLIVSQARVNAAEAGRVKVEAELMLVGRSGQ